MKKPVLKVRKYEHSSTHPFLLDLRAYGKGRLFFKTRAAADAEAMRQRTLLERHSREAIGLSQRELSDFITTKRDLAAYDETINDAVKFRVDHLERVRRHGITVAKLVTELLEAKRKDGLSKVYLRDLHYRVQDFGQQPIAEITVAELDNWLRALPYSPQSRTNYRTIIGLLFSYAESREIIERNPILRTAKPNLVDMPPEIFGVDELSALLEAGNRVAPDVVPMLAIGAFAGIREAEIQRLGLERGRSCARPHRSKSSKSQQRSTAHYSDPAKPC
jgi:hypothetical protein